MVAEEGTVRTTEFATRLWEAMDQSGELRRPHGGKAAANQALVGVSVDGEDHRRSSGVPCIARTVQVEAGQSGQWGRALPPRRGHDTDAIGFNRHFFTPKPVCELWNVLANMRTTVPEIEG